MSLGEVFGDEAVARAYQRRPPYPEAVFKRLQRRLVAPRIVLDAGAGTGALARRMTGFAERIDAVEPSAAMIAEGRGLPGGSDRRIRLDRRARRRRAARSALWVDRMRREPALDGPRARATPLP